MEPRINPSWVANEAMGELDPVKHIERGSPLIWLGCNLQLRQLARQVLARHYEVGTRAPDDLFPDLQWRYPTARSAEAEEPEYVLRDMMSNEDLAYNVSRLRAEALAKQAHADTLERWGATRL